MIGLTVAAVLLGSISPQENAAESVSKMLAGYANAKTISGNIKMTQSLGSVSVQIDTYLQLERPGKLYLRQERKSLNDPRTWIVSADGTYFSYAVPAERADTAQRLIEAYGPGQDLKDAYNASARSMGDRDAPLAIAISRQKDLEFVRNQWVTVGTIDPKPEGSDGLLVVGGKWREYKSMPSSGTFEMWLTPDGELKKYIRRETIAAEGLAPQSVITRWDVDLAINGKVDPNLFQLVRSTVK